MSKKPKKLKWGHTPWDDLPREDLLRELQRAYNAVESARSVMHLLRQEDSLFWRPGGTGHIAMTKCSEVVERVHSAFDDESVFRSFYRYAVDLLFDSPDVKSGWTICPNGHMTAPGRGRAEDLATSCFTCNQPVRPIEWGDLAPK